MYVFSKWYFYEVDVQIKPNDIQCCIKVLNYETNNK